MTRLAAFIMLRILQSVTFIPFSSYQDRHHLDSEYGMSCAVSHSTCININEPLESLMLQ